MATGTRRYSFNSSTRALGAGAPRFIVQGAPRIVLLQSHAAELQRHLDEGGGHEQAAAILFRRIDRAVPTLKASPRFVSVAVHPFPADWITTNSPTHVAFRMECLRELFRQCEEQDLCFGFAHNHPNGELSFSAVDDANEITLTTACRNRNGSDSWLVFLLRARRKWASRVRHGSGPNVSIRVRHTLILGQPLELFDYQGQVLDPEISVRQIAAFGAPFVEKMQSLRVGVVGCGGTGSPVGCLLARAGIGEIVLVDGDCLEASNLNRVRGARREDVGRNKADILASFIDSLGLSVSVGAVPEMLDLSAAAIDSIASCDLVFGCTDDQIGRETLLTASYIYALPYIDLGLGGMVADDAEGEPYLKYHFGRVSTISPEQGECLFCQGVIAEQWIRHQYALRERPQMSQAEAQDRYLEGGGEQAPGVGPFTSAIADFGVATLFDLLKPFRKIPPELRSDFFTIDFVRMQVRSKAPLGNQDCPYCGTREFTVTAETYRLNRPALGRAK